MKTILAGFVVLLLILVNDSFADSHAVNQAGFVVQNLDNSTVVNIIVEVVKQDGTIVDQITKTLDPQSSERFNPADFKEVVPGISYSGIVVADGPVAAVGWLETTMTNGTSGGIGWYNMPGSNDVDNVVYVPMFYEDPVRGLGTDIWVQNAGSSEATISVTYYAYEGLDTYIATCPSLKPVTSLNTENSCSSDRPSSFKGTAVISADQPIAVVVNLSNPLKKTECLYNASSGGSGNLFFPVVQNNYQGWYSNFSCQNVGASQAQSTFSYRLECDNTCPWEDPLVSDPINPGRGYVFTPMTDIFSGYGEITTSGSLFSSVAWIWNDLVKTGYCYNSFEYPVLEDSIWPIISADCSTRVVVKNTSDKTGTIKISWQGQSEQQTEALEAYEKLTITPPDGWLARSGVIESTDGDMPLAILVVNKQSGGNDLGAYNALGSKDYTGKIAIYSIYIPVIKKSPTISSIWKVYNPATMTGRREEK